MKQGMAVTSNLDFALRRFIVSCINCKLSSARALHLAQVNHVGLLTNSLFHCSNLIFRIDGITTGEFKHQSSSKKMSVCQRFNRILCFFCADEICKRKAPSGMIEFLWYSNRSQLSISAKQGPNILLRCFER